MAKECIKGSRVLRKLLPGVVVDAGGAEPNIVYQVFTGGWTVVTNDGGIQFAVLRDYFDIAGWNQEQLTAFITGVSYQEGSGWKLPQATIGSYPTIETWDIISKSYLPNEILDSNHWIVPADGNGYNPPGMSLSNYNLEEIFDGRFRSMVNDSTTANELRQVNRTSWGTGDATAGDRVYITRIVRLSGTQASAGYIIIPPMAIVIPAVVVEEKDLVYMERLRRSYVLGESRL
jgi:hypothetical protein